MPVGIDPVGSGSAGVLERAADALSQGEGRVFAEVLGDVPAPVVEAMVDVLHRFARGQGVVVGSLDTQLTTSQAAQMLGISRTYLVRLERFLVSIGVLIVGSGWGM